MSNEMEKIRKTLSEIGGHIQDLRAEQSQTNREMSSLVESVQRLQARTVSQEAVTTALAGTFASLEQILVKVLTEQDSLSGTVSDLLQRVEALERKAS